MPATNLDTLIIESDLMKHLITTLTILATFICNAQTIKPGDYLKTEFKKIIKPYYFAAPSFTGWTEGANMLLIGDKPNPNDCDFVFIALQDTTLIGVFTTKTPNTFLLDTDGNSILGKPFEFFLLPLFTIKNKTKIASSDKTVLSLLDKFYDITMQANEGQLDEKTIRQYQQFQTDTTLANRHIILLFDSYQTLITKTAAKGQNAPAELCVPLMKSLSGECLLIYNRIPAIVCIYMGEALQSAGMVDKAREHFKMSLQFYPNSIPLLVYNYRLEQDPTKKKEQLADLKKKYLKHWMVKDL
ncbi:MAG: hypothetical protein ABIQ31_15630 [Ferruginibacter sp.]